MRILLVTETLVVGGAETFVVRLANALAKDHQVTVAVIHGEQVHPALRAKLLADVRLEALLLPAKRSLFRLDRVLRLAGIDASVLYRLQRRWLRELVRRTTPDILHSHLLKADRLASDVSRETGCRHVVTLHGDYGPYRLRQADPQMLGAERRMREVLDHAAAIVGICREHVDFVGSFDAGRQARVRLIYNGCPAVAEDEGPSARALGLPDGFRFGMVSRGVEGKGWREAVDAFAELGLEDASLILVGQGPFLDTLAAGSLPDNVVLAGFSATPTDFIRHFNVCLLPTRFPFESLPNVVVEYLACGKPVIATDVGEIGAMMTDPSGALAGRLIPFDGVSISQDALRGGMAELHGDADLRADLARSARAAFAKFDMTRCAEAYHDVYREAAAD